MIIKTKLFGSMSDNYQYDRYFTCEVRCENY